MNINPTFNSLINVSFVCFCYIDFKKHQFDLTGTPGPFLPVLGIRNKSFNQNTSKKPRDFMATNSIQFDRSFTFEPCFMAHLFWQLKAYKPD